MPRLEGHGEIGVTRKKTPFLIFGRSGVGKTELLHRLVENGLAEAVSTDGFVLETHGNTISIKNPPGVDAFQVRSRKDWLTKETKQAEFTTGPGTLEALKKGIVFVLESHENPLIGKYRKVETAGHPLKTSKIPVKYYDPVAEELAETEAREYLAQMLANMHKSNGGFQLGGSQDAERDVEEMLRILPRRVVKIRFPYIEAEMPYLNSMIYDIMVEKLGLG